ncbi:MAG: hypothetical protein GQ570_05320 [Helicobacteraceae bacterium]|nr:hypothetical protein [Helicobacteraceae bacterium]
MNTYESIKQLFSGKMRINQKELATLGIGSESTILRRKKANEMHLLPIFRQEGRICYYNLTDVADYIEGKSSAADM